METYKIFPDLLENSNPGIINFYATYEDAKNQTNSLFAVSGEEEFIAALESLSEEQKVLHTLIFEKDEEDRFILVEYQIGE